MRLWQGYFRTKQNVGLTFREISFRDARKTLHVGHLKIKKYFSFAVATWISIATFGYDIHLK